MFSLKVIAETKTFQLFRVLSKKEQIVFLGAVIIFVITGLTYSVLFLQTKTQPLAAKGGEFEEGVVGQPAFINPILPTTEADRDISRLLFSSASQIADSIKLDGDNKTYHVRIKENIRWHDGEKLTADDIIFTLELIQNPEAKSPLYASFQGVAAERVSELEVKFVLQSPYAFFETDHLRNLNILPKHIFNDIPVENLKLSSYGLQPIGSGPYKIGSYKSGGGGITSELRLNTNDDYFEGAPNIESFTFKFYRNNTELIRAYNLGQVDGFGLTSAEPLTDNEIRVRHRLYEFHSPRYYAVFINPNLAPVELKRLGVREALSSAVDRERIIKDIFLSHATPYYGPTILSPKPSQEPDFKLLTGLKLNLVVPAEPFLIKTSQMIKANWEAHGVEVNLQIFPAKIIQEEVLKKSNYEMLLFGNIAKESEDLFAFWHSSRRFYPDQNLAFYQSTQVDRALEEFRRTFNSDRRLDLLKSISNAITADTPAVFLYNPHYVYVAVPQLGGLDELTPISTSDDRFADVANWYVKTKRVFGPD